MGKRELFALLSLSFWCLVIVGWLFLAVPWVCLQFVIVVFPDHTHLLFFEQIMQSYINVTPIKIGNRHIKIAFLPTFCIRIINKPYELG